MKLKYTFIKFFLIGVSFLIGGGLSAQVSNILPVTSSLSFLKIIPDARATAMGGIAIASDPDPYNIYNNSAKSVFNRYEHSLSLTYSPLFLNLGIKDIHYMNIAYSRNIKNKHSFGIGLKYLSLGKFQITDNEATVLNSIYSYEGSLDLAYSYKIIKNLSVGVNFRIANSAIATDIGVADAGNRNIFSLAGDIGLYYTRYFSKKDFKILAGFVFSNLGAKITNYNSNYTGKNDIPRKIAIEGGISKYFAEEHKIFFGLGISKILLKSIDTSTNQDKSTVTQNYFSSFIDTEEGALGFFRSLYFQTGLEYAYRDNFFARIGYRYRDRVRGGGSFLALGVGVVLTNYNAGIDISYVVPLSITNIKADPMYNTIKLSIYFELFPTRSEPENIRCAKVY